MKRIKCETCDNQYTQERVVSSIIGDAPVMSDDFEIWLCSYCYLIIKRFMEKDYGWIESIRTVEEENE